MESEIPRDGNAVRVRLAKEALLECEKRFRILLDAVNEGVIVHDKFNIFGKIPEPEEYIIKAKDGRQIPAEIQSRPVQADGRMLMPGMVREVGEKRKADAALRRAVEEIETLVERCRALEIRSQTAAGKNGE